MENENKTDLQLQDNQLPDAFDVRNEIWINSFKDGGGGAWSVEIETSKKFDQWLKKKLGIKRLTKKKLEQYVVENFFNQSEIVINK